MKVSDDGGFQDIAPGTHRAICYRLLDLGTQSFQNDNTGHHKVVLGFETPDELVERGEWAGSPLSINSFYTATLAPKSNLRRDLESWRGRPFSSEELGGFELKNILGKPCLISVGKTENGKTVVNAIMALPKSSGQLPARQNKIQYLSLDPAEFDQELFDELPEGFQKLIEASPEFKTLRGTLDAAAGNAKGNGESFNDWDDDIPF